MKVDRRFITWTQGIFYVLIFAFGHFRAHWPLPTLLLFITLSHLISTMVKSYFRINALEDRLDKLPQLRRK